MAAAARRHALYNRVALNGLSAEGLTCGGPVRQVPRFETQVEGNTICIRCNHAIGPVVRDSVFVGEDGLQKPIAVFDLCHRLDCVVVDKGPLLVANDDLR